MSDSKTGAEHITSLRDGRTVCLDGTPIDDVTTRKAFRNSVASAAALYDVQARAENIEAAPSEAGTVAAGGGFGYGGGRRP